jgi:hypothetical protein
MSKFGRLKKGHNTTAPIWRQTFPYRPTGYVEKPEEKAAQIQTSDHNVLEFIRHYAPALKLVKYTVPGLNLDTMETLETDGLIGVHKKDGETLTGFLEPRNLRVLAWVMGVNETCRLRGLAEPFPGLIPGDVVLEAPTTSTVH